MNIAVIVPVLDPDSYFVELIKSLKELGLSQIIIMDDASVDSGRPFLEEVKKEGAFVYHHTTILGRGACIKEGIQKAKERFTDLIGYVTVDPDGLYSAEDVLTAAKALDAGKESLILGLREEAASHWHDRSYSEKHKVYTGLRAYTSKLTDLLLDIPSQRSTYETEVLNKLLERGDAIGVIQVKNIGAIRRKKVKFHLSGKSWLIVGATVIFNVGLFFIFLFLVLHYIKSR